jgi:hypothetical protein
MTEERERVAYVRKFLLLGQHRLLIFHDHFSETHNLSLIQRGILPLIARRRHLRLRRVARHHLDERLLVLLLHLFAALLVELQLHQVVRLRGLQFDSPAAVVFPRDDLQLLLESTRWRQLHLKPLNP